MTSRAALALAILIGVACSSPTSAPPPAISDGRYVMGTVLEITLREVAPERGRAAIDEIFALAKRYDALMSLHDPESELARLNVSAGSGPITVAPEDRKSVV